jgi:hypothetical protein
MVHTSDKTSRKINEQIGDDLETKYELLAQCIRSDQLSAAQVWEEFRKDPTFYKWFEMKHGLLR